MDIDEPGWQLIDDFVERLAEGRKPETTRRYARTRHRLTYFLDTADMSFDLGPGSATLLDAEREFHPHGAFWLLYGPDELVACLPGFVSEPWLPEAITESRVQISVASRLIDELARAGEVTAAAAAEAGRAMTYARHQLDKRSRRPDESPARLTRRLLGNPGADW
jgi:hypothetical protein